MDDFRATYLPYCLIQQADGRYAVVNRRYKPLGYLTGEWVEYADKPILCHLAGLDPATTRKLSWNGSENTDRVYLYNDGCVPTASDKNMNDYLGRVAILAKLKVSPQP
ncbi:MAG: hypothetical protein HKM00_09590 [Gallionella sp.]|nr:hypothetical protein [Gallionella sp.]